MCWIKYRQNTEKGRTHIKFCDAFLSQHLPATITFAFIAKQTSGRQDTHWTTHARRRTRTETHAHTHVHTRSCFSLTPSSTSSTVFLLSCIQHGKCEAASRRPRCQTPPAPVGWAACCAPAGRTGSGTVWSAPRSGCAGRPASESSWRKAAVPPDGAAGCRPAGSPTVGLGGLRFVRDPGHLDGLQVRRRPRDIYNTSRVKSGIRICNRNRCWFVFKIDPVQILCQLFQSLCIYCSTHAACWFQTGKSESMHC